MNALSINQAAAYLHINRITLYRMLKRGELPGGFKVGRVWRIARADLERFTRDNSLAPKR